MKRRRGSELGKNNRGIREKNVKGAYSFNNVRVEGSYVRTRVNVCERAKG